MRKAFIILTANATTSQQDAIGKLFNTYGWWHYFPQAWIVLDQSGLETAESIRDKIQGVAPRLTHYVFAVKPGSDYAGFAPEKWDEWLKDSWK